MELRSFFTPHERVQFKNEILDLKTGEFKKMPTMTKQEFKAECDINNIMKQYRQTGIVSHINQKAAAGAYLDLPDSADYQDSLNQVMAAEAAFATLPSTVRDRFANDPAAFLAFCTDPKNLPELRQLGLAPPEAPSSETSTTTTSPAAPPPSLNNVP